jgi:hypothetical protein
VGHGRLHPAREPLAVLQNIRRTIGEYNFAGQYQQSPAPLGGGLVNAEWFVFRANEPTAHRTYAHYILTQGALGSPLAPGRPALTGVSGF